MENQENKGGKDQPHDMNNAGTIGRDDYLNEGRDMPDEKTGKREKVVGKPEDQDAIGENEENHWSGNYGRKTEVRPDGDQ